jgi:hypothetical protein
VKVPNVTAQYVVPFTCETAAPAPMPRNAGFSIFSFGADWPSRLERAADADVYVHVIAWP